MNAGRAGKEQRTPPSHRQPARKTLPDRSLPVLIKTTFEIKVEPESIEKTIQTFVQACILDFTETDKFNYKAA